MTEVLKKIDWTKPLECISCDFLDITYIGKYHDLYVVGCTTPGGHHYSCTLNEYGQPVAPLTNPSTLPFVCNKKTKKSGWTVMLRSNLTHAPYMAAVFSSKEALLQFVEHLGSERLSEPVEFTWEE